MKCKRNLIFNMPSLCRNKLYQSVLEDELLSKQKKRNSETNGHQLYLYSLIFYLKCYCSYYHQSVELTILYSTAYDAVSEKKIKTNEKALLDY